MEELLPCPFCGKKPVIKYIGNEYTPTRKIIVKCPLCRIQRTDIARNHDFAWIEKAAIEQWNLRTNENE